ncbi:uncharacterized protein F5147DRAFT_697566 [Suillus discolor]|uniref:Uncharacterized protein n=1 Tax=Suillus discolor TaxID=1912936 RepID=A0A9P7F7D0_9AGAM|nr:uncharacterized protein F5147DRAFT_697566 [Suillus discolor]KAG2107485.1 hypothetical protein F5147DRAFT_697566 [Suillus discolor]
MEERIEEELSETVEGWSCMTDKERRDLRRVRIGAELGSNFGTSFIMLITYVASSSGCSTLALFLALVL